MPLDGSGPDPVEIALGTVRVRTLAASAIVAAATLLFLREAGVARVSIVRDQFAARRHLTTITQGLVRTSLQLLAITLLTFLLLATGDLYKRKVVKLAGLGRSEMADG